MLIDTTDIGVWNGPVYRDAWHELKSLNVNHYPTEWDNPQTHRSIISSRFGKYATRNLETDVGLVVCMFVRLLGKQRTERWVSKWLKMEFCDYNQNICIPPFPASSSLWVATLSLCKRISNIHDTCDDYGPTTDQLTVCFWFSGAEELMPNLNHQSVTTR